MIKRYTGRLESKEDPERALKRGLVDIAVSMQGQIFVLDRSSNTVKDLGKVSSSEAISEIEDFLQKNYYTSEQVDSLFSKIDTELFVVVAELPAYSEEFNPNKIYLLPRAVGGQNNKYDEYRGTVVEVEGTKSIEWEVIGSVEASFANYYNKQDVDRMIGSLTNSVKTLQESLEQYSTKSETEQSIQKVEDSVATLSNKVSAGNENFVTTVNLIKSLLPGLESSLKVGESFSEGMYTFKPEGGELYIFDSVISGGKGSSNGKILFDAEKVRVSGVSVENAESMYNVFEQVQSAKNLKMFEAKNLDVDAGGIVHNIFNLYGLENGAEVLIQNVNVVNLDPTKTNMFRVSNYNNATDVTIRLENVNVDYKADADLSDPAYFGLLLYQAVKGKDTSYDGVSCVNTWTVVFKNCYLNGVLIDSLGFGTDRQVAYAFDYGGGNSVTSIDDPEKANMVVQFE